MVAFTTISSTHACTQNVEFSVAKNANFNSASPVTTTGYVTVWLDATTLAAGDVLEIRTYKAVAGGTLTADDVATIQTAQIWTRDLGLVQGNWDFTIKLITAAGRTLGGEVTIDTNDVNTATISNGAIGTAAFVDAALTAAKFATDAIGASAIAAAAVTKIQSGLALAATALSTVQWTNARAALVDNLDANVGSRASTAAVASIQADTTSISGRLPSALDGSGNIKAGVQSIAASAITAAATAGDFLAAVAAQVMGSAIGTALDFTSSPVAIDLTRATRVMFALAIGKLSGVTGLTASSPTVRDPTDTKDVIRGVVTPTGRSAQVDPT